jgi:hypothetical protein
MNLQNQRSKKIISLVGAICGSLVFGLPAIAQNSNPNQPYNGNGQLSPNNDRQSPDTNNPGINQSPSNRLTPTNPNSSGDSSGTNQSPNNRMSPSDSNSGYQQQYPNSNRRSRPNSNSNTFSSSTGSAVLNPCPSIFYEPKYRDSVGIPSGCPATPGTSTPQQ